MTAIRRLLYAAVALAGTAVILAACNDPAPGPSALADEVHATLETLNMQHSPRDAGADQQMSEALYLQGRFRAIGYDTSTVRFSSSYTPRYSYMFYTDTLSESDASSPTLAPIRPHLHRGLPGSPPRGFVTAPLTPVGDTTQMDISDRVLEGMIALIMPGTMTDADLVRRITRAGAVGAIFILDEDDAMVEDETAFPSTENVFLFSAMPDPRFITVVLIGRGKGRALLELIERGDVTASIKVDVIESPLWSELAHKSGSVDDPPRQVILGANYDTAEDSPGANEDSSGFAVLLTVARHITERDYPFDIRIVLFGAEEQGLLGSKQYVENMTPEEIDSTIAVLNFDTLGSGPTLHAIGDSDLTSEAMEIGRDFGAPIDLEGGESATNELAPFEDAGIPTLFLSSNETSRINPSEDAIEQIDPDLLGYAAEIGIAMLDRLAE